MNDLDKANLRQIIDPAANQFNDSLRGSGMQISTSSTIIFERANALYNMLLPDLAHSYLCSILEGLNQYPIYNKDNLMDILKPHHKEFLNLRFLSNIFLLDIFDFPYLTDFFGWRYNANPNSMNGFYSNNEENTKFNALLNDTVGIDDVYYLSPWFNCLSEKEIRLCSFVLKAETINVSRIISNIGALPKRRATICDVKYDKETRTLTCEYLGRIYRKKLSKPYRGDENYHGELFVKLLTQQNKELNIEDELKKLSPIGFDTASKEVLDAVHDDNSLNITKLSPKDHEEKLKREFAKIELEQKIEILKEKIECFNNKNHPDCVLKMNELKKLQNDLKHCLKDKGAEGGDRFRKFVEDVISKFLEEGGENNLGEHLRCSVNGKVNQKYSPSGMEITWVET